MAKTLLKLKPKTINKKINEQAFFMYQSMGTTLDVYKATMLEALLGIKGTKDAVVIAEGDKDKDPIHVIHVDNHYIYFTTKGDEVVKHYITKELPTFINEQTKNSTN